MKLCFILICLFSFGLSANTRAQQERVNLKLQNVSLKTVLDAIQVQTQLHFMLSREQGERLGLVSVEAKNETVETVLEKLFRDTELSWTLMDGIIVVKERVHQQQKKDKNLVIGGLVTDVEKKPLPGVTVLIKGTSVGTVTNVDGRYTFIMPSRNDIVLVFSFVGMKSKEVKYEKQQQINVVLEEDVAQLDEVNVVTTGYQTINRKDMVGSFTTVRAEDIMMPAYTTIDQMLQGQVAGLMVINSSSRVGSTPKIQLRGTTTLLGNQDPLWVVDGIIQTDPININASTQMTDDLKNIVGNQISWLNPMDIESITVLKDASATAVYGSRASNGVIVVTTKKGKRDRLTVNYAGALSVNTRPDYSRFNLMNSQERIRFSDEAFDWGVNYRMSPYKERNTYEGAMRMQMEREITLEEFAAIRERLETVNTDWFKLLTRTGMSHNHTLSLSGGGEKVTYMASVGYSKALGQEIGNDNERFTGRIGFNVRLHERVRVNLALDGSVYTTNGFFRGVNPIAYATSASRAIPAFEEDGSRAKYQKQTTYNYNKRTESLSFNFMDERDATGSESEASRFSASATFQWDITDWLKYEFTGGYARNNNNNESYATEKSYYIASKYRGYDYNSVDPTGDDFKAAVMPFGGVLFVSNGVQGSYNIQNKLLVSKTFNEHHRLNVMLGTEVRSSSEKTNNNITFGYVPDRGEAFVQPPIPSEIVPNGNTYNGWGILRELYSGQRRVMDTNNFFSYFATVAYSLMDRYVANVAMRNDVSNRFGQDVNRRFDPTWSFGLSWRVTNEGFLQNRLEWLSRLNLKATYGIQGNVLTNKSPELLLTRGSIAVPYNQYTSKISRLPNPLLSWERTKNWNFGMELELFKKVTVMAEYYTRSSNAVVMQDIPYEYGTIVTGGKSVTELNGGMIHNRGVEVTLGFTPVRSKNWALNVSVNASRNWNKTGKTNYPATYADFIAGKGDRIIKDGYPVGGMWSYSFAGLSPYDGRPVFNYLDFPEDQRGASVDPTLFLVYTGKNLPDVTGGINLNLRFREWTLSTSFAFLVGAKKRLPSPYSDFTNNMMPSPTMNLSRDLNKRWKKAGDERYTHIPGLVNVSSSLITIPSGTSVDWMDLWAKSDVMVANASFLRCRQLTLAWNVRPKWCRRIGLKSLSASANINNLFVLASGRFNGFDPELGDSVMPKMWSLGVNIGF